MEVNLWQTDMTKRWFILTYNFGNGISLKISTAFCSGNHRKGIFEEIPKKRLSVTRDKKGYQTFFMV